MFIEPTEEQKTALKNAVQSIRSLQGIRVELVGAWVWVSGDTKPHKETLKAAGYRWAHKKQMWYFAGIPSHHSRADLWYLKNKYGSVVLSDAASTD